MMSQIPSDGYEVRDSKPLSNKEIKMFIQKIADAPAQAARLYEGVVVRRMGAPDTLYEVIGVPFLDEQGDLLVDVVEMETREPYTWMVAEIAIVDGLSALGEQAE
jgi:hypothetical protein